MTKYKCVRTKDFISFSQVDERDPDDHGVHPLGISINIPEGMWKCIIEEAKKDLEKEQ